MKVVLITLLLLSSETFAGNKILEVQARSTTYYDVETTFNGNKAIFTSRPNGEQSHFKRYADQIDTFNTVTICYRLKSNAPRNPPNAKSMAVAVVNFYQSGKKMEILRDVSSWTGVKGGSNCTNYSFNFLADTRGNYKLVDFAKDHELEKEAEKHDEDEAVAVMKDKNLIPNREGSPAESTRQEVAASPTLGIKSGKIQNSSTTSGSDTKSTFESATKSLETLNRQISRSLPPQIAKYGMPVVLGMAFLSLLVFMSAWRLFTNSGEPGVYTLIPGLNVFIIWKISGTGALVLLTVLVPLFIVGLFESTLSKEKIYALAAAEAIGALMLCLGLARRFGKGTIFGVGLLIFPWFFLPVLAKISAPKAGKLVSLSELDRETDTYVIDDVS